MATTVTIKVDDKEYTLAFSKATIKQMSEAGFNIDEARKDYVKGIPQLFAGSFLRYHRTATAKEIDTIWDAIPNKMDFMEILITMYNEQLEELFGEPDENAKKAVWEVVKK